ncbi:LysM peptidoglycan-binding domain-containing protein (plasmid) [Streptomyces sp. DSM 116496]|uniref:LysM peptidoglycan-binding domain-containing protein n=1 Tax=Streptomyces stoeckheimensis TaxID=3344656 RepID=UPI0038B296AA
MPKPTTTKPPGPRRTSGAHTAAALLRALLSLAVLLALLGGLPVLLWWATAQVGPPGLAALSNLLSTDDSGQVFLLALAVAGWAGWAAFACAVLLEIPAQLRGRAAPQIRGLVGQRAAAALVGAVLLALPAGPALATPASAATSTATSTAQTVSVSAAAVPGTPAGSSSGIAASGEAGSGAVTHTVRDVRPAESLWSIAEQTLGDGERWTDIAALNEGHTMAADGTTFHADRPIQPGWTLTLPADATPAPSGGDQAQDGRAPAAVAGQSEYRVEKGDSLARIAGEQLGDAAKYQEIFDLNQGEPVPGGGSFTNPDLIYPGQQLTLPPRDATPAEPGSAAPAPPAAQPERPAATPAPPAATPPAVDGTQASPAPAPAPSKPSAQTLAPTAPVSTAPLPHQAAPTPAASSSDAPATAAPQTAATGFSVNWTMTAGIGTLLAASLAGALGLRRILQQRRRRAGQTIAQDSDPTTLEQLLGATGTLADADILDQLLRTLAHQAGADGRTLPALRGAHLTTGAITLLLDEPAEPIAPFAAGPDALTWILDNQTVLPSATDLQDVEAPYPGLVTLGATDDGLLLADLMTCRVLLLDGTPDEVLEVARALALELGTCKWTDYSEILTAGLGTRLAGLLPQGRVRTMPHLSAVAADLGELLLEAHQSGEQVLPWLLIGAGDHDEEHVTQLAEALAAARTLQTALVLPLTPTARRVFPHAEILDTTRDQESRLEPLGLQVTLQRVTDEQYREYVHALTVSTQDPVPATGAWEFTESHEQPAATGQPLTVRVTSADAQDPGNPFPALLAGLGPTPAPHPATDQPAAGNAGDPAGPAAAPAALPHQPAAKEPEPPTEPAAAESGEATGVRIDLLGPLRITGGAGSAHAHTARTTAVAALIHLRPGRSTEYLCKAMDPVNPWKARTLHSRLAELRSEVGATKDGLPLLPRPKDGGGYTFHRSVTSDWDQFRKLASRGLAAGPKNGIPDLESAMGLVRGKPFDGRSLTWADPVIQEMLSRITDTAHTLALWHTDGSDPDLDAARRVVQHALDIEESSEVLYRDLLHIEWAADNTAALHRTIARIQQMARTYDITLDTLTEDTINLVLSGHPAPAPTS